MSDSNGSVGRLVAGFVCLVITISGAIIVLSSVVGTLQDTAQVTRDELGPQALNRKYEWFKDAYAQLDAKRKSLKILQGKISSLEVQFQETKQNDPSGKLTSQMFEELSQSKLELEGLKLSYNDLAAQYNAEMAKFHTSFVNAGKLPAGGGGEIPREVATYIAE